MSEVASTAPRYPWEAKKFRGMPYRRLGGSGLRCSDIGLGCWKFGLPDTGDEARVDRSSSLKLLDRAAELGVTFWDTANRYNAGTGNSERVLGHWFRQNPTERRNIVLATKVFGGMEGYTPNHARASRQNLLDGTYGCLDRLQVDHIDLLYVHQYDDQTPIEETLSAIEDLVRDDLVRYFAVSNFKPEHLESYRKVQESLSIRSRVVAVQNQFDIVRREFRNPGVLRYCAENNVSFIPWAPLAQGLLTERYLDPKKTGEGDRLVDEGTFDKFATEETMAKVRKLADLAHGWELTLAQLALAYTLTLPGMGPQIPSSSSVEQLEANAKSGTIELDDERRKMIQEVLDA